ncbi:MAG: hypothetical protein WCR97_01890 [Bacilli bacterium]
MKNNNIIYEGSLVSKYFSFKCTCKGIVDINPLNVALAESMIIHNSSYKKSTNTKAYPKGDYYGSSSYWAGLFFSLAASKSKLTTFDADNVNSVFEKMDIHLFKTDLENITYLLVSAIDRENSTHLNAKNGRIEITIKIINIIKSGSFFIDLENKKGTFSLVTELSRKINERSNYAFATKFCHYLCLYSKNIDSDTYVIFDSITSDNLGKYDKLYRKSKDFNYYKNYYDSMKALATKNGVSLQGLDHLLWYYYK